jgi:hypothetical protein
LNHLQKFLIPLFVPHQADVSALPVLSVSGIVFSIHFYSIEKIVTEDRDGSSGTLDEVIEGTSRLML